MRRHLLGVIALLLLLLGGSLWLSSADGESIVRQASGSLTRIGFVLGAIWLALPQLQRIPPWFGQLLLVGVLIIAVRPRYALVIGPLVLAIWMVRPRNKSRAKPPSRRNSKTG